MRFRRKKKTIFTIEILCNDAGVSIYVAPCSALYQLHVVLDSPMEVVVGGHEKASTDTGGAFDRAAFTAWITRRAYPRIYVQQKRRPHLLDDHHLLWRLGVAYSGSEWSQRIIIPFSFCHRFKERRRVAGTEKKSIMEIEGRCYYVRTYVNKTI